MRLPVIYRAVPTGHIYRWRKVSAYLFLGWALSSTNAFGQQPSRHSSVSRCFFIYAPMMEVGKARSIEALKAYATERLIFVRGYMEANRNDSSFDRAFKEGIGANKSAGISLEKNLIRAIENSDTKGYNIEVAKGAVCDREIGFKQ